MATTILAVMMIATAMILQPALCMRQDEDPYEGTPLQGTGDTAADKLAAAKDRAAESSKELAGAVIKSADDNARAAETPVAAPQAGNPGLVVASDKPTVGFSEEESPMLAIIKKDGLKNYDADHSGDLDIHEFRDFVHDLNPVDPLATSDSEMDRLLQTYDMNEDRALSLEEVETMLKNNRVTIAKLNVEASACNGWSPSEGPDAGKGISCQTWGFQVEWCWIFKEFMGLGKGAKWESDSYPGKYFAPCTPARLPGLPLAKPTPAPNKVADAANEALDLAREAMEEVENGE